MGWNTYTIDLYDPINGTPVTATAPCSQLTPWKNAPTISSFRLDPNENYTGMTSGVPAMVFTQKIAWIKLTKTEQVRAGVSYTIQIQTNESLPASAITYYYTTDPTNPKQHPASVWSETAAALNLPYKSYVPAINKIQTVGDDGILKFHWNTTGVTPGDYYICSEANDTFNKVVTCSTAPVTVTN